MMKSSMEFVNLEIAKKLKEKGYPQIKKNTLAMYNEDGDWYSLAKNLDEFEYSFEDFDNHDYVCPTISQVLKWLRNEKGFFIAILPTCGKHYFYQVMNLNKYLYDTYEYQSNFMTYEECAFAGIEYVLDKLI